MISYFYPVTHVHIFLLFSELMCLSWLVICSTTVPEPPASQLDILSAMVAVLENPANLTTIRNVLTSVLDHPASQSEAVIIPFAGLLTVLYSAFRFRLFI